MSYEQTSFPSDETMGSMDSREFQALGMGYSSVFDPGYLMYELAKKTEKRMALRVALKKGVDRLVSIAQLEDNDILPTREGIYEELEVRDPSRAQSQSRAIGGLPKVRRGSHA